MLSAGPLSQFSEEARGHYDALLAVASRSVIGLDFDGTLAPVVDDPEEARIHPDAGSVLARLGGLVRAVAVVTGRPARQAVALGDLDVVGAALQEKGTELFVLGQYGNERWTSTERRILSPRPPAGLASFERELPSVLRAADAADAYIEEKGLAIAVHTRRLPDAAEAFERVVKPIAELSVKHRLAVEPGRLVVEVRSGERHKGHAVMQLAEECEAEGFFFAGDDLGDVEAFEAVLRLRAKGLAGLLVCSASDEEAALAELGDVVVDGPHGVMELLSQLADDLA